MQNKIYTLIFGLFLSLFAFQVFAQTPGNDISLNIKPAYPVPGDNVSFSLTSFGTDLNKSNISWSVNGQQKISAIGQKNFSFNVGDITSTLNIEAHINTIDGQEIFKRTLITPTEVDMLWQGKDSFTPPFYKGRSFVPEEGYFKVVAMPNINSKAGTIDVKNLSYNWNKDDSAAQSSSGFGKNSLSFKNSYLDKNNKITVTVSDISGNNKANGSITLNTTTPKILFYKNNPNLGIDFSNGIDNSLSIDNNITGLLAMPYFLSPKNLNSNILNFTWSINGSSIATPNPKNILTIKPNSGQSGTASIKLDINNSGNLFGDITKTLNVNL